MSSRFLSRIEIEYKSTIRSKLYLRTFALIVSAHPYCSREFTCHVMHRARALSDRADGHCYTLLGFNDLGRSVTPAILFRNRFYLHLSRHCPKINKTQCGTLKKISRFLSTGQNLFFEVSRQLTRFALIGLLKSYLAENISLQSSNCNSLGLVATVAFFANESRFTQI